MNDPGLDDSRAVVEAIQALYTELALHPQKDFGWGAGKENARRLGYDRRWLTELPDAAWESAAAVGNPFCLGPIGPGETVVDVGCGAGVDLCIAAHLVCPRGRAIGIDITPAMVAKAEANARLLGLNNVQFHVGDIATLPLEDQSADVVISNGAINLSSHKSCVFREAFRILRCGGRLQFADMVRDRALEAQSGGSWADCVAGTVEPSGYLAMLEAAGFHEAEMVSFTSYRTAPTTIGATFRARRP